LFKTLCQICETNEHITNGCPTLPSFKECLHEQVNVLNSFRRPNHNPYSQTYNPGWRDHPNFSSKSSNNNTQTSQPPFQAQHNFQNSHGYAPPYVPLLEEILRNIACIHWKARDNQHSTFSNHDRF
jgi:hypothetical protein